VKVEPPCSKLLPTPKATFHPMSKWLVRMARRRRWQPFFIRLHRIAHVGMNYWGGAEVAASGEEVALRMVASRMPKGEKGLVFDIGANSGAFMAAALGAMPDDTRIISFEPARASADLLVQRIEALRATDRVRVERIGFSDHEGEATLSAPVEGSSIATLHTATFELHGRELLKEEIQLSTVDAYCEANGIQRIHYLKVDTEGHEWAVLKGARRMIAEGRVDHIQFEFGECHLDSRVFFRDLFFELHSRYRIHRILLDGLWPLDEYKQDLEVFRTANYLAVRRDLKSA